MSTIRVMLVGLLLALVGVAVPAAASGAEPYCGITWGSGAKVSAPMGLGEVDTVRTGEQACYDRVVVDIDGPPAGYRAEYVDQVTADGSGHVVTTPGGAKIQFVVNHPRFSGPAVGASVANVSGYRTLRSVVYAGSFEGMTTYGVGTRARLPFRVFTLDGGHGRIVLDVAHQW